MCEWAAGRKLPVQKMDIRATLSPPAEEFMECITVAFCADSRMEVALHVAAFSVLSNICSGSSLKIYVMVSDFPEDGISRLRTTLGRVGKPFELVVLSPDVEPFVGLRPFHGSLAAYYRLLLPALIAEERFLYLDLDTVTALDVSPLFSVDMQGYALGFVATGRVEMALEKPFFLSVGMVPSDPCFNSGVMLVDTKEWEKQECFRRVIEFCHAHPNDLLAADQTALNVLFAKDCFHLDSKYNVQLSTIYKNRDIELGGINHFVGSPKPWDLFGDMFHPYASFWKSFLKPISLCFYKKNPYLNIQNWWRLPHIAGGYLRIMKQRSQLKTATVVVQKMDG